MAEGWDPVLGWRSPNFVYRPTGTKNIKLLLKNYRLSDDIAFRFSEQSWKEWPLDAKKFANWVKNIHGDGETINLFMDYETFGEHQWSDTGIFDFLRALPEELSKVAEVGFQTPTQTLKRCNVVGEVDVPHILTWADTERDLSAWTGNDIQRASLEEVYKLGKRIVATKNRKLIEDWRRLQTSDHFYYMCTKWFNDGDVHKYFSPYETPYNAYIAFSNALRDVQWRIQDMQNKKRAKARKIRLMQNAQK
jgi:alpha-amylase